ncbi:MAG: tetratricopeptide repeat protein [Deinococcota bacterium]
MPRVMKVTQVFSFLDEVTDWLGGNPFALTNRLLAYLAPDISELYAQAVAQAWISNYPDAPILNDGHFMPYVEELAPESTSFQHLTKQLIDKLHRSGDLRDETHTSTANFRHDVLTNFKKLLNERPDILQPLLLDDVQKLRGVVEQLGNVTDAAVNRLDQNDSHLATLRQQLHPDELSKVVGEEAARWLQTNLAKVIATQGLLESARQQDPNIVSLSLSDDLALQFQVDAQGNVLYGQTTLHDLATILRRLTTPPLLVLETLNLPSNPKPSALLSTKYEVVPFTGREDELADLEAWCANPAHAHDINDPFDLRVYTGAGGVGKTRLMRELCTRKQHDGWRVGFLRKEVTTPETVQAFCESSQPTLMIVDYSEDYVATRDNVLSDVLNTITRKLAQGGAAFRVVLLARTQGEWWNSLQKTVERNLLSVEPVPLAPLAQVSRKATFQQAAQAFANKLNRPVVDDVPTQVDLDNDPFGRVLLIHMQALLTVERTAATGQHDKTGLHILDGVLQLEQRHWKNLGNPLGDDVLMNSAVQQLLSLATLGYTVRNERELVKLCDDLPDLEELERSERRVLVRGLAGLYKTNTAILQPLQPDILGEHLVERTLLDVNTSEVNDAGEAVLTLAFDASEPPANYNQGLATLVRLAQRRDKAGVTLLEEVVRPRLDNLARLAVTSIPRETLAMRELAVKVTQAAYAQAKHGGDEADKAYYASWLGVRLGAVGRREDALAATQEAVTSYRQLAETRPDAFLPDLADALNNLGNRFSDLGRREDALIATQEAVTIRRQLAEAHPDAFLPDLADALNNLGRMFSNLGRPEDALATTQEAVSIHRELAKTRPDDFLPDLADALNNLGIDLSDLGRPKDALIATQKAVSIHRQLAEARPDAFLPDLATSLGAFAQTLEALDQSNDAIQAYYEEIPCEIRGKVGYESACAETKREASVQLHRVEC